jgi:hypothetical protein
MISLARSTGGAAGAAVFGALVFALIPNADRQSLLQQASRMDVTIVVEAFHRGFLFAAAVAGLAAFTASRIPHVDLHAPPSPARLDAPEPADRK